MWVKLSFLIALLEHTTTVAMAREFSSVINNNINDGSIIFYLKSGRRSAQDYIFGLFVLICRVVGDMVIWKGIETKYKKKMENDGKFIFTRYFIFA